MATYLEEAECVHDLQLKIQNYYYVIYFDTVITQNINKENKINKSNLLNRDNHILWVSLIKAHCM